MLNVFVEWARWGLNPGPEVYETPALTTELQARFVLIYYNQFECEVNKSLLKNCEEHCCNHCVKKEPNKCVYER